MTDRIAEIRERIAADNISTTEAIEEFIYRDIPYLLSQLAERDMEIERLRSEVSRLRSDNEIIKRMYVKMCEDKCGTDAENNRLIKELSALTRESIEREKTLARLEAEVMAVTEPKRGEWIEAKSGGMSVWPPGQVMCSVCKQRMPLAWKKMPPYCYGCGAKLEDKQ